MSTTTLRLCAMALLLPLAACVNMSGLSGGSKYACTAPEGVACDSVSGTYANAGGFSVAVTRLGGQS